MTDEPTVQDKIRQGLQEYSEYLQGESDKRAAARSADISWHKWCDKFYAESINQRRNGDSITSQQWLDELKQQTPPRG